MLDLGRKNWKIKRDYIQNKTTERDRKLKKKVVRLIGLLERAMQIIPSREGTFYQGVNSNKNANSS